jgi:hypothetical protein
MDRLALEHRAQRTKTAIGGSFLGFLTTGGDK